MTSLTKNPHLPTNKFFLGVQTKRLAASFDALTRSVALASGEIAAKSHVRFGVFFENILKQSNAKVLRVWILIPKLNVI